MWLTRKQAKKLPSQSLRKWNPTQTFEWTSVVTEFQRDDMPAIFYVDENELFSFFGLHGIVLTTSATHPNELGEIIELAVSKSGKEFFKVRFADGSVEWLNEDQVLSKTE